MTAQARRPREGFQEGTGRRPLNPTRPPFSPTTPNTNRALLQSPGLLECPFKVMVTTSPLERAHSQDQTGKGDTKSREPVAWMNALLCTGPPRRTTLDSASHPNHSRKSLGRSATGREENPSDQHDFIDLLVGTGQGPVEFFKEM